MHKYLKQNDSVIGMSTPSSISSYDLIAQKYDALFSNENVYYGAINAREREIFDQYVHPVNGTKDALDIGCGTGFNTQWLAEKGFNTVGIDTSSEMLRVAEEKSLHWDRKPELLFCNALYMKEIGSRSFDVITCFGSTLNHIHDWNAFIGQVAKHLRPGGYFIFSFDNNSLFEAFYWLIKKKHSGYHQSERWRVFSERISSLMRKVPFRNHWRMSCSDMDLVVKLTYESAKRCEGYLLKKGLNVECSRGVHLLSYLAPKIMDASAYLEHKPAGEKSSVWDRVIKQTDNWLSKRFFSLSANIVMVAKKNPY